ncbi:Purine catabolism regulatory protein [Baekduia alba]|uniref:PucR family transcriptional regulator n=1 Tax=Baekduia alba TaxID=2997333 RepID=UPI002342275E|nr:PucR family transcriptional regulator [Baekduia alba]WCB95034.1 Purine catabolism regulatory protein [Baekduia alba]
MDDSASPRITVAAALELPALRRGLPEVVAGAGHLERPIRWVHAGEVPNIASLLRGGELLLTTGMGVGAKAADQRRFVAELAARQVAALVIELGHTYNDHLPPALVVAAERHDLPLVELHAAVPFVAVTEAIHTEIVNHHYDLLRRAEGLQERFTGLMLQGGGIPGVLALLAEALANPVFLEAADGRLLYHAAPPSSAAEDDPVGAWSQAARGADALGVAAPVPTGDADAAGRLLVLPVDAPLDAFAALAIDRAAGIVALALLRTRQEDELLARGRGDLLAELAAGRVAPDRAAARATAMGFADRGASALLPLVARLGGASHAGDGARVGAAASWLPSLRDVERDLAALGAPALVGVDPADGSLLVVLALRDASARADAATRAADVLHAAAPDAVIAVGGTAGWPLVARQLKDAAESSAAAQGLPPTSWHDATRMDLDRLLWRWRDRDELAVYVERVLGAVVAHDARRKHQLMPTLEALCACGGRKAETARALHLNRQALYDRIARLEAVLQSDLSDTRTLLALHLALQARRHVRD